MADGAAFAASGGIGKTIGASFLPTIWQNEVVAAFEKNVVMANLVRRVPMDGKKGAVLSFPAYSTNGRGSAYAKANNAAVTLNQIQDNAITVSLNKHYEYSVLIEDIEEVQGLDALRMFHTENAGYQVALQKDSDLIALGRGVQAGSGTAAYTKGYIGGDGSTLFVDGSANQTALTDSGFRRAIQRLDDAFIPSSSLNFVVPPSCRNTMLGLSRFTEQAFNGDGTTLKTGKIGSVYGVEVFVSPNCDTTTAAAARVALLFHKEAFVLAEQKGVRVQTQYKQEFLATLLTADTIYGVGELRDDGAVALVVPA